jgi:DNA-binding LacI/PurR family transcriptional regulator
VKEKTTLRDIAKSAGVSLSTVSQALNNRTGVSAETRARVLKAAATLGYRHQVRLAAPVAAQITTIGLIVKQDPENRPVVDPFYYDVMRGIEEECQRLSINLMYASVRVDEHSHVIEWPQILSDRQIDGFLVLGAIIENDPTFYRLSDRKPVVLIDGYSTPEHYDRVGMDNTDGMYRATAHLIQLGHRHIGFIGGAANAHPSILERRSGYSQALKDYGIDDYYVEDSRVSSPDIAMEAALKLLKRAPHLTAIAAATDYVAIGVIKAAYDLGIRVPGELSVTGFDDIDMAAHTFPPLTTLSVDKQCLGLLGIRRLYDRAAYPDHPQVTILVHTPLIVRESTQRKD